MFHTRLALKIWKRLEMRVRFCPLQCLRNCHLSARSEPLDQLLLSLSHHVPISVLEVMSKICETVFFEETMRVWKQFDAQYTRAFEDPTVYLKKTLRRLCLQV